MKTEKRDVFVADDGKVFETAEACQAHELAVAELAKRIERLRVYSVSSNFDGTEGRGYHARTYIITDASYPVVLDYCFDRYGKPLSGWYGDGFYEAWLINQSPLTADEALKKAKDRHFGVGDTSAKVDVVFLSSTDIDHSGLPPRSFPWPRKAKEPAR